jgi:hypothetical protein
MRAITIQQPYAECVARGAKLVENRSRRVFHRGPIAIHAGLRLSKRGLADPRVNALLYPHGRPSRPPRALGMVIAVAELVDCHPAAGCCKPWGDDLHEGRPVHHLVLEHVRPLARPIPAVGRLGLWNVDLPEGVMT